ncbi:MAG: SOS response-associated peptidase [Burkholderiales bacterium]|nr:SOS response-associated peptidase [Sorangiineae bacterium]
MCGRYVHPDSAAIERAWHVGRASGDPFERRYNVLPTTPVPILRAAPGSGALELVMARWGFIPHWWKEARAPQSTINARSEEAAAKPMWRDAYRRARCLIPAEGWYEWREMERIDRATGEVKRYKQPYFMRRADGAPFCFAGLMAARRAPEAEAAALSCAILTRAAAGRVGEVHDRMPVVLPAAAHAEWVDPALTDAARVAAIVAGAATDFRYAPVSTAINGRGAEGPRLIEPIALPHP